MVVAMILVVTRRLVFMLLFAVVIVVTLLRRGFGGQAEAEFVCPGGEFIDAGPLERKLRLQEAGIEVGGPAEIEAADVEHAVDANLTIARPVDPRRGVHPVQARLKSVELGGAGEVGLVEQNDIGERHLLLRFLAIIEVLRGIFGVDDRHNAIQPVGLADLGVSEESLGDGPRIGEAGGLDEHAVEAVLTLEQPGQDPEQVAAHGAAEAPVVHGENLFIGLDDQLVVHADLPKFVFDHGNLAAVLLGEHAVEQRGLAGPKKTGEHGDGNAIVSGHQSESGQRIPET